MVTVEGRGADRRAWAVSGLKDLVVAKTTGSEFWGFLEDEYPRCRRQPIESWPPSLVARWRYHSVDARGGAADGGIAGAGIDFDKSYTQIRAMLLKRFGQVSYALQQTLYAMGESVLEEFPEVAEIRFKAPNKHHFLVDLSPFGDEIPGEVFYAADRPYGLIEAGRRSATTHPHPGSAWNTVPGFC